MSQEEIEAAIDRLVVRGEIVSGRKIRQELGDQGSNARIHQVLSTWRRKQIGVKEDPAGRTT